MSCRMLAARLSQPSERAKIVQRFPGVVSANRNACHDTGAGLSQPSERARIVHRFPSLVLLEFNPLR